MMASRLSLEDRVTIPSTLTQAGRTYLESPAQRLSARLRESGMEMIKCPSCGACATREELLVHRPGQDTVRRVVVRCWRSSSNSDGRSCPVQVELEESVPEGTGIPTRPRPVHSAERRAQASKEEVMQDTRLICSCGCNREFRPRRIGQRFASQACRNRFNSRARREREKLGRQSGAPAGSNGVASHGGNGYISLAELAERLVELTPEQEAAVRELVRVERERRSHASTVVAMTPEVMLAS